MLIGCETMAMDADWLAIGTDYIAVGIKISSTNHHAVHVLCYVCEPMKRPQFTSKTAKQRTGSTLIYYWCAGY